MQEKKEAQDLAESTKKKGNLKSFLNDGTHGVGAVGEQKPLADLFLETTVVFADIAGFTSWSSVREVR